MENKNNTNQIELNKLILTIINKIESKLKKDEKTK
jgi:hypothetical protein